MKVIAAINGSIAAESMAFLALRYAQEQAIELLLLHVKNHKDDLDHVHKSAALITQEADAIGVACETVILKGHVKDALQEYLANIHIDTFFCSTRIHKSVTRNTFSEIIFSMKLNTDIAIVRIVHLSHFHKPKTMMLPIKEAKLSVKKFTFFATLASAFESDATIYSITPTPKKNLEDLSWSESKAQFASINFDLRHYMSLSKLMPFTLLIKHTFAISESEAILKHMADSDADLVILGAKRFSFVSWLKGERPIEHLMRETSKNLIAYYPKED